MIIKLSPGFKKRAEHVPSYIASGYVSGFVSYVLDYRYRKGTELKKWLRKQVSAPDEALVTAAKDIPNTKHYDEQVIAVLQFVQRKITYKSDKEVWDTPEYWATAAETWEKKVGDCEDGAILAYVLCRLKGVPADRLYIFAGDVVVPGRSTPGGHAWLGYRPEYYPLNWAFLDWCYYYTRYPIESRQLFYVNKKSIKGYQHSGARIIGPYDNYQSIWFLVNEDYSHTSLRRK